jgi:hypothetical protein
MQASIPNSLGDLSWLVARKCSGGSCVRVAKNKDAIVIGDSKSPQGPILTYSRREWIAFVEGVHRGDFDDLA